MSKVDAMDTDDDVPVICERCHKKQITRQGQPCIRCGHDIARTV